MNDKFFKIEEEEDDKVLQGIFENGSKTFEGILSEPEPNYLMSTSTQNRKVIIYNN